MTVPLTTDAGERPKRKSRAKAGLQAPAVSSLQLLDINDICSLTRFNEKTIGVMVESGEFPQPMLMREESRRSARRWTMRQFETWAERKQKQAEQKIA